MMMKTCSSLHRFITVKDGRFMDAHVLEYGQTTAFARYETAEYRRTAQTDPGGQNMNVLKLLFLVTSIFAVTTTEMNGQHYINQEDRLWKPSSIRQPTVQK